MLLAVPLKVTEPVPEVNVPSFTQFPLTSKFILLPKLRVPPAFTFMLAQVAVLISTVTVLPLAMLISSTEVGTILPTHVAGTLHNPPVAVDVIVANKFFDFDKILFSAIVFPPSSTILSEKILGLLPYKAKELFLCNTPEELAISLD